MTKIVLLDAGPLSKILHPRVNRDIIDWFKGLLGARVPLRVPEIADYEVRRKLLHIGSMQSVERLDKLEAEIGYVPITTSVMRKAAEFWSEARKRGKPTADDKALDGDMILSAQAAVLRAEGNEVLIATENVAHLSLFADARNWRIIRAD